MWPFCFWLKLLFTNPDFFSNFVDLFKEPTFIIFKNKVLHITYAGLELTI